MSVLQHLRAELFVAVFRLLLDRRLDLRRELLLLFLPDFGGVAAAAEDQTCNGHPDSTDHRDDDFPVFHSPALLTRCAALVGVLTIHATHRSGPRLAARLRNFVAAV